MTWHRRDSQRLIVASARGQRVTWRNSMLLSLPLTEDDRQAFVDAFDDVLGARAHLLAIE